MTSLRCAFIDDHNLCLFFKSCHYFFTCNGYSILGGYFLIQIFSFVDKLLVFSVELSSELVFPVGFSDKTRLSFGDI